MDKKKQEKVILLIIFLLLIFSVLYFGVLKFKYQLLYKEAIKQGAEMFVTSLEMLVVCEEIGTES